MGTSSESHPRESRRSVKELMLEEPFQLNFGDVYFLSPKKLARALDISVRTLWRWVAKGKLPRGKRMWNHKDVYWHVSELPKELFP